MPELYTVRRRSGGRYFEEVISAESWEDASVQAERMGGEVTGTLFEATTIQHDADYDDYNGYDPEY